MLPQIETLLTPSGRVSLKALEHIALLCEAAEFAVFLRRPVLAGSGIQPGALAARPRHTPTPNATHLLSFEPAPEEEDVSSEALRLAIYPLIKEPGAPRAAHVFTIGRVSGNDLIIPDVVISKQHAIIELGEQQRFYLRDRGSTNGTRLNGERLDSQPRELHDSDILTFGRYAFSFLAPASLHARLTGA
ncbi:MAG: FHA domain-containing protein [Chromatiaceae bacterium]|nr:FHA domain-containing protein [Chromatiaceae bacterium]